MPQFYEAQQSEVLAYQTGFVEFDFCGSIEGGSSRQRPQSICASGQDMETPRIVMLANLSKFLNLRFGKLTPDSPAAVYFHGFRGLRVPLEVMGTLSREKNLFRFKPLAISQYTSSKCPKLASAS